MPGMRIWPVVVALFGPGVPQALVGRRRTAIGLAVAFGAAVFSIGFTIYGLVAALTADLGNAPVGDTGARTRLVGVAEMASGLGWSEVERIAVTALRRWAVAGAAV